MTRTVSAFGMDWATLVAAGADHRHIVICFVSATIAKGFSDGV
jgi:hypothetical protein